MKKTTSLLFIIFITYSCSFIACKSSKNSTTYPIKKVTTTEFENFNTTLNNATIDDVFINENEMVFIITYKGCKNQKFELLWDGTYLKSLPPQVNVLLQTNNSSCNKTINKRKITFQLKKLQHSNTKEVQINFIKSTFSYKY